MGSLNEGSRPSFQTGRQLLHYRRPPGTATGPVPLAYEDLEGVARAWLTPEAYDWVAGGAGRGDTIRANLDAFDHWRLVPRMLCDITERDASVTLFGRRIAWPLLVAPIGVQALLDADGEVACARGAAAAGVPFVLSTVSSRSLEDVATGIDAGDISQPPPRWFQLYWPKDQALTESLIGRAEASGYEALVVTLDTPTLGWRESNLRRGYLPFLHGEGLGNYLSDPIFRAALPAGAVDSVAAAADLYLRTFSNPTRTWADLPALRRMTKLPLLVKGIQDSGDARRAVEAGADGIVVSNHGGRQVDGAVGSLDALPDVVAAVGGRVPVLFDGGIRRGCDAVKALALGAAAVLVGRPVMWALAIGGEEGVADWLRNFQADFDLTMALCGCRKVSDLGPDFLSSTHREKGP